MNFSKDLFYLVGKCVIAKLANLAVDIVERAPDGRFDVGVLRNLAQVLRT